VAGFLPNSPGHRVLQPKCLPGLKELSKDHFFIVNFGHGVTPSWACHRPSAEDISVNKKTAPRIS
jgi:hypothetical protein